jgi:uncharacterized protein (DUF427 family)
MAEEYPKHPTGPGHVAPSPRRVRGYVGDQLVFDTVRASYVWEIPPYPQYYIPVVDIAPGILGDENDAKQTRHGLARQHGLRVGEVHRPGSVLVFDSDATDGLADTARFDWAAVDAWFEEDEQIFVHPRNPYARVDAVRSSRPLRVELGGVVLARTDAPVIVFETGLPPRFYVDRGAVTWSQLRRTETRTACPYKGITSDYWSVVIGEEVHADLAWSYNFPTAALLSIAGLVAFFDEHVDTYIDGALRQRPVTPFSRR